MGNREARQETFLSFSFKRYLVSLKLSGYGIINLKLKVGHINAYVRSQNSGYH